MTIRTLAVLAALSLPMAAAAETVVLNEEAAGATLHANTVDMSVYWTAKGDAFELTAIYAAKADAAEGGRLVMTLVEGDSVSFGLPGHVGQLFTFAREGDAVRVVAETAAPMLAAIN